MQRDRLNAIEAEIARRGRAKETAKKAADEDTFKQFVDRLNEMAERLRASPDWREPTPEEQELNRQQVEETLRDLQARGTASRRDP